MALNKKVYGVKPLISPRISGVHGVFDQHLQKRKPVAAQSEIGNLAGFELEGQFISDKSDEFRIRGFSLGIGNRIPKEPLKGVQIAPIPGDFNGVADGPLHTAGGGLEGLCHLGIEHLGDGVDYVHIVDGNDNGLA